MFSVSLLAAFLLCLVWAEKHGTLDRLACLLPANEGPCRAMFLRAFYNSAIKKCQYFTYGGCGGNANRFRTMEECRYNCDRCFQDPDPRDSLFINFTCYYYNARTKTCETFAYSGCGGNDNNFETAEQCEMACFD